MQRKFQALIRDNMIIEKIFKLTKYYLLHRPKFMPQYYCCEKLTIEQPQKPDQIIVAALNFSISFKLQILMHVGVLLKINEIHISHTNSETPPNQC